MQKTLLSGISILTALSLNLLGIHPAAAQSFTFSLDEVEPATQSIGYPTNGPSLAKELNIDEEAFDWNSPWEAQILANSFADAENLHRIGEDVVFQMLLQAFCQHRPVTLTPDAIWMVICQQFSYCVNRHPEEYRRMLVKHEGKKEVAIQSQEDLFSGDADWQALISGFTSEIAKYTSNDITTTLVADFSTTGIDERIASKVTLMDVVKPYFAYKVIYAVCGIPSITLTGTPDDWRKVLEKTQALEAFGLGWWTSELEPILEEFIRASEGNPDYWFWKDIVMKTRPQTIQGPSCARRSPRMTEFDGWFLKFFPYDNDGRTHDKVTITQTMLPETVVVPFKYQVVDGAGTVLSETPMELVAGIVGVTEDPKDFNLTPKIGWIARTARPEKESKVDTEGLQPLSSPITMDSSLRYWEDGALTYDDFSIRRSEFPLVSEFDYGISWKPIRTKIGNTSFENTLSYTFMNPYSSWVHPDFKTPMMLEYLQAAFDYVEICRRRAQNEYQNGDSYDYQNIGKFHLKVADSFITQMKEETQQGLDSAVVHQYAERVRRELAQTREEGFTDILLYPRGFSTGLRLGLGNQTYLGPFSSYVNGIFGVDFGFDIAFSRFNIFWTGLIGSAGHCRRDLPRDGYVWAAGDKLTGGNIELSLGYTAYDSQWWRVVPFAGIGVGFIDNPSSPKTTEKRTDEMSGFRLQAGISADYKFYRAIARGLAGKSLAEFTVNGRLFVARDNFSFPGPAWSINFGVSVMMLPWIVR